MDYIVIDGVKYADDRPKHNFRLADSLPYAKEGRLQELLDELYPDADHD